jgi:hypothetical protein
VDTLQRKIGAGVTLLTFSDFKLLIDTTLGSAQIYLPKAIDWVNFIEQQSGNAFGLNGFTFSDIGGNAAVNNITFIAPDGDTIAGEQTLVISTDGASGSISINADNLGWAYASANGGSGGSSYYWDNEGTLTLPQPYVYVESLIIKGLKVVYAQSIKIDNSNTVTTNLELSDLEEVYSLGLYLDNPFIVTPIKDVFPKLKKIFSPDITFRQISDVELILPSLEIMKSIGASSSNAFMYCDNVESISFPLLKEINYSGGCGFGFFSNPLLTNINMPKLNYGGYETVFIINNCPSIKNLDWAKNIINNVTFSHYGGVDLDAMIGVSNDTWQDFFESITTKSTTYISLSGTLLIESVTIKGDDINSFIANSCSLITKITANYIIGNVDTIFNIKLCNSITSVLIPLLKSSRQIDISDNPFLTSLVVGTSLSCVFVILSGNALNQLSIDNILSSLDLGGEINGFVDLSGGTNASPTSGAANANVVSLQGKGWTVTIN